MNSSTKSKNQSLAFNDLKLDTIVIELRYKFAFLFWDIAGELWNDIEEALPGELAVVGASPSSVSVVYADKYDILVEQERFALSSSHPNASLPEFISILETVFETIVSKLNIETFSRIGFRQIFVKDYSSMRKAIEALRTLPSIVIPQQLLASYENDFIAPGLTLRVEDDTKGMFFNLRGVGRSFETTIPAVFKKDTQSNQEIFQQSLLTFDIDFYTKMEIQVGQLSILDWVKQANEIVKRDASKFF